jgi:hypothetical protein
MRKSPDISVKSDALFREGFILSESQALKLKLNSVLEELKETVDVSLLIKEKDATGKVVPLMWEDFLRQFITYVQARGRETGQNLFNGISLSKIR